MKLAVDLGTKTGYAFTTSTAANIVSGVWDMKPGRFDGGGMRILKFRENLAKIHAAHPIDVVWYEEVRRHLGTDAAHLYGALGGQLMAFCEEQTPKIPYEGVPVGAIKKWWTGKGNAPKELMVEMARRWGYEPVDDNEADAIAILHMKLS
ncbi:MAG: hypothetical protein GEV06_16705 [Luteitalea sp.]|nr:hypothetical protein [Luteitalea sp.]